MSDDSLVSRGMEAFESGDYKEALACFSRLMREDRVSEDYLYEIGVCEIRCACDRDSEEKGISILEKVVPGSAKFSKARYEIRVTLYGWSRDGDPEVLGRIWDNELEWLRGSREEALENLAPLVLADIVVRLVRLGVDVPEMPGIDGLGLIRDACLCEREEQEPGACLRLLEDIDGRVKPMAELLRIRFLTRSLPGRCNPGDFEKLIDENGELFDKAVPGWRGRLEDELERMKERRESLLSAQRSKSDEARARRLIDEGRIDEALEIWSKLLEQRYNARTVCKMAAAAWHYLKAPSKALAYLGRLRPEDRRAREASILFETITGGWFDRIRHFERLGLRMAAFEELKLLRNSVESDGKILRETEDFFIEQLCSPWLRLVRERLRSCRGLSFKIREKDSPVWKLLRQARERMDGENEGAAGAVGDDDPSRLPRVEKEASILTWMGERIIETERRVLDEFSLEQYGGLVENRKGLEEFENILGRIEPILVKYGDYSEKSYVEVKDFIGSFLPGSLREKVCNEDYLDLVRLESEVEQDLGVFLRKYYETPVVRDA